MWRNFLLAFIPIFVAVDALGILPIYMALTAKLRAKEKRSVIVNSMITAAILAVAFIYLGKALFKFLGISIGDFMIAGGLVLFAIAIKDIVGNGRTSHHATSAELAAVPLGTPLIVGPAVLATSLIMIDQYGARITLFSVLLNILIAGLVFAISGFFNRLLGERGLRVFSKVAHLLLAAIAIMLIRKGFFLILH